MTQDYCLECGRQGQAIHLTPYEQAVLRELTRAYARKVDITATENDALCVIDRILGNK